jgi:Cof subfamily protein (haloacid dehalogenase superfamily)
MIHANPFDLVVLDFDGTLSDPSGRVHPATKQVFAELRQRGVRVVIATGRNWDSLKHRLPELEIDDEAICLNGAAVYDISPVRLRSSTTMPPELWQLCLKTASESGHPWIVYTLDGVYAPEASALAERLEDFSRNKVPLTASPETLPNPVKILLEPGTSDAQTAAEITESLKGRGLYSTVTGFGFVEILQEGVHKGQAAARLAEELGVPRSRVLAIGDNGNDLELLSWAGEGVAMGNASPKVLSQVPLKTGRVEEAGALHYLIQRFGLSVALSTPLQEFQP